MRIAAIDIGSNSVRSTIFDVPVGGARRTLDDEKAYTRLSRGLAATGRLSERSIEETIEALGRMIRISEQFGVSRSRAVATAAVRDAANGEEFVALVHERLGLDIEVISEQEEGRLAFLSAEEAVGPSGRWAVVDIGGGSTEIVTATDRTIDEIVSVPLGVVVLSERYHAKDPMPRTQREALVRHVHDSFAEALGPDREPVATLVGSGGSVVTAGALVAAERDPGLPSLHGYSIARERIDRLVKSLEGTSAGERLAMKGMPQNRIDIIQAGLVVLDQTMEILGADAVTVNTGAIREGMVVDMIEREQGVRAPFDRMQAVRDFSRRYQTDAAHAEQVRRLSLLLFDDLHGRLDMDEDVRPLLEAAALLHDVGYHVAYERHHIHSHHLIRYSRLPGFDPRQVRMIAAIARYHGGSLPRTKHAAMADLSHTERRTVTRLAALLRVADGLDRSRGQRVDSVEVKQSSADLEITITGLSALDVEAHDGTRRADLLAKVLKMPVRVVEAGARERAGTQERAAEAAEKGSA